MTSYTYFIQCFKVCRLFMQREQVRADLIKKRRLTTNDKNYN